MKKLIIFAVALLALGFAANSFAIQAEIPADTTAAIAKGGTQVTIGGELRFRGQSMNNTGDFNKHVVSDSGTFGKNERMNYDYRYRLNIEAKVTPNTTGFLQLTVQEGDTSGANGAFGEGPSGSVINSLSNRNSIAGGESLANGVFVSQAWIQHKGSGLLGIPAYIKIGHQPITVGAGVFYSHTYNNDDAIVVGISPIKGLDLTALTVKLSEGYNSDSFESASDDMDLYSLMVSYAINKDWKIGVDGSLVQLQHQLAVDPDGSKYTAMSFSKFNLYNIGFNVKGSPVPGLKVYGTADFQLGSQKFDDGFNRDFRGYAFTLGGSYKFAPVTASLDLGYGSGDNNGNDNKISTFMTAQTNTVHYAFVYDYQVANSAGQRYGGVQNIMFAKLGLSGDVMKNLNIGGSIAFLNAAKKAYGDDFRTGLTETSSRYIGTEVDATLTYQIDKGLKYFVEAGYLFAGNFWKVPVTGNADGKISDPWVVRHGIQLNF